MSCNILGRSLDLSRNPSTHNQSISIYSQATPRRSLISPSDPSPLAIIKRSWPHRLCMLVAWPHVTHRRPMACIVRVYYINIPRILHLRLACGKCAFENGDNKSSVVANELQRHNIHVWERHLSEFTKSFTAMFIHTYLFVHVCGVYVSYVYLYVYLHRYLMLLDKS